MYKTFAQFILHTFWCILMHIDAFWALTKKKYNFLTKKMKFLKLKSHAQNMLISHSAYILMHLDASWCILMHSDAFWCILSYLNLVKTTSLINSCTKKLHNSFWCILMHFDAFWCILMHFTQNASKCIQNKFCKVLCSKKLKKWFIILLNAQNEKNMHQNASKCIKMYAELIV